MHFGTGICIGRNHRKWPLPELLHSDMIVLVATEMGNGNANLGTASRIGSARLNSPARKLATPFIRTVSKGSSTITGRQTSHLILSLSLFYNRTIHNLINRWSISLGRFGKENEMARCWGLRALPLRNFRFNCAVPKSYSKEYLRIKRFCELSGYQSCTTTINAFRSFWSNLKIWKFLRVVYLRPPRHPNILWSTDQTSDYCQGQEMQCSRSAQPIVPLQSSCTIATAVVTSTATEDLIVIGVPAMLQSAGLSLLLVTGDVWWPSIQWMREPIISWMA